MISLLIHVALLLSLNQQFSTSKEARPVVRFDRVISGHQNDDFRLAVETPPASTHSRSGTARLKQVGHRVLKQGSNVPNATLPGVIEQVVPYSPDKGTDGVANAGEHSFDAVNLVSKTASESFRQSDIQQYRISLAKAARRFKRYPALAKERGWEGVVEIELRTSSLLQSPEIDLLRTSGYLLLDTQALEMVTRAVRVMPIPEGLSGSDFSILLPIRFSLEGQSTRA